MKTELMRRAYAMLNMEIDSWDRKNSSMLTSVFDFVVNDLRGQQNTYKTIYPNTVKLSQEVRKMLFLTDIPLEDMIVVLEKLEADYLKCAQTYC